eukprot:3755887-Amphidinium_carterae.1
MKGQPAAPTVKRVQENALEIYGNIDTPSRRKHSRKLQSSTSLMNIVEQLDAEIHSKHDPARQVVHWLLLLHLAPVHSCGSLEALRSECPWVHACFVQSLKPEILTLAWLDEEPAEVAHAEARRMHDEGNLFVNGQKRQRRLKLSSHEHFRAGFLTVLSIQHPSQAWDPVAKGTAALAARGLLPLGGATLLLR